MSNGQKKEAKPNYLFYSSLIIISGLVVLIITFVLLGWGVNYLKNVSFDSVMNTIIGL